MKKYIPVYEFLIVLVIGVLGLLGCSSEPGIVKGVVSQASSGEPIAQAQIVVFPLEKAEEVRAVDAYTKGNASLKQATDENGAFSISLEEGSYVIEVWVESLEVGNRMVKVKGGRTINVDFPVDVPSP